LLQRVDDAYTNSFLRPLNNTWQDVVNQMPRWHIDGQLSQTDFYAHIVTPVLARKKVAVIVVDAMRYDIGAELFAMLQHDYESQLQAVLGVLPSYTQLGQAALLPHQQLRIQPEASMGVSVDQRASAGLVNRRAILQQHASQRHAITGSEFSQLNRDNRRDVAQQYTLLYLYHDTIDKTGENQESQVCHATVESLAELRHLVRSLMDAGFSAVIITADHGFLYQHQSVNEGEFMVFDDSQAGMTVFAQKRRMVTGRNLPRHPSLAHFTATQLGLNGDTEVLIPYGIHRLRLQGAQSRYVHGGATLQEVVVPVLTFHKSQRASGTTPVGYKVTNNIQNRITTAQFVVQLYQEQPISAQIMARQVRIDLYADDGTLIGSGPPSVIALNSPSSNSADRVTNVTIVLNEKAPQYYRQQVWLRVAEPINDTTQYTILHQEAFQLIRTIVADF